MSSYQPPKVWQWKEKDDNRFASINRPTAGARQEKVLVRGRHPLQLYSLATPNGVKVTLMLEELLALGIKEAEYDAHLINIMDGEQFGSGFTQINPNSKIPALIDQSDDQDIPVFESGAILVYLAEKFDVLIPKTIKDRAQCFSWLNWLTASAPILGGGFGHFYAYAAEKQEYPIDRYAMEVKRQLDVLDKHLANNKYLCGDEYSIADIATAPWYGSLVKGFLYEAAAFLNVTSYQHVQRWADDIFSRQTFKRACVVNRVWGEEKGQLAERHEAADIDAIL